MGKKLLEWRERAEIACVVLNTDSEKAFCAGGDIKSLVVGLQRDENSAFARDYFTAEYLVDYLIHVYPKPILCWADGIAMGGGIGIMNGAYCRVVTERSVLAMPEVAIGFFTDVGATYFLNRLPGKLGLFLGLTGTRFDGFDAVAIDMAEGWVKSEKKQAVFAGLQTLVWTKDPQQNKQILRRYLANESEADVSRKSNLLRRLDQITGLVDKAGIDEIDAVFRSWKGNDAWIESALQGYFAGSPTSAKTIFEQLSRGKALTLKEAFLREWNMAMNYCICSDVSEGVRALLIDKGRKPRWNPPVLSEVKDEEVERYFSPPGGGINLLEQNLAETGIE
jgi:enoyl-CoA hydratase/carnithine racemase